MRNAAVDEVRGRVDPGRDVDPFAAVEVHQLQRLLLLQREARGVVGKGNRDRPLNHRRGLDLEEVLLGDLERRRLGTRILRHSRSR